MANTKEGGAKVRQTMINKFGSYEAYKEWLSGIASKGGKNGTTGGFAYMSKVDPERHKESSRRGGEVSRRKKAL